MKVNQLSVFIENEPGRLYNVSKVLEEAKINIRALSLAETENYGILRMIVDNTSGAREILNKDNYTVNITEVIAVQVEDKPGGLAVILKIFEENNVNIEYMYAYIEKKEANAVMIFRIDAVDQAIGILQQKNITLYSGSELVS